MQALEQKNSIAYFKARLRSVLQDRQYKYDVPYFKQFISADGVSKYKLTIMRCVKNKLVEQPSVPRIKNHNAEKLDNNLQRSKATIYEYAYCNKWDYFFTGTLDKTKANREDLRAFNKQFKTFITNFNRIHNCKIRYLIIPELHDDLKSWHFHGFLADIPEDRIREFKIGDKMR